MFGVVAFGVVETSITCIFNAGQPESSPPTAVASIAAGGSLVACQHGIAGNHSDTRL